MAPRARCGPQGAENRPKARGQIYHGILPKVCPVKEYRSTNPATNLPIARWAQAARFAVVPSTRDASRAQRLRTPNGIRLGRRTGC